MVGRWARSSPTPHLGLARHLGRRKSGLIGPSVALGYEATSLLCFLPPAAGPLLVGAVDPWTKGGNNNFI